MGTMVTGTGTLNEDTDGGSYKIKMQASFITENWSGNICEAKSFSLPLGMGTIKFDGMDCPLKTGNTQVKMDITMSSAIPSAFARSTIHMTAVDTNNAPLLCLDVKRRPLRQPSRLSSLSESYVIF